MLTTDIKPSDLIESIESGWRDFITADRSAPAKHPYVYASAWRACTRRMTLEMVEADKLPLWKPEQLANFRRGNDRERDLLADLQRIGRSSAQPFSVVGQQERFELKDRRGRVIIVGKKDAEIAFDCGIKVPLEIKSWNQNLTERITKFEDLFNSTWTKAGAHQLLAYLYGFNRPFGILLLDRRGLPLPLLVELEPHLQEMEDFLYRAEKAVDSAEAYSSAIDTPLFEEDCLPDFIQDASECKRCPFYGSVCNPPIKHDAATILTDPELLQDLERREELKEAASEYDDMDKSIKAKLRGVEMGLAGNFLIEGKYSKSTRIEWPDEATKKKYQISDPKGKFTLTITKV